MVECYYCDEEVEMIPENRIQAGIGGFRYACNGCRAEMVFPKRGGIDGDENGANILYRDAEPK
jgi:hypothetical protein